MTSLDVYLTTPDAVEIKIGLLSFDDILTSGRFIASFTYSPAWLAHPNFFPLDPESLPATTLPFKSENLNPPLSVFQDSLPDDWGKKIMVAKHALRGMMQAPPHLLEKTAETSLGALSFFRQGTLPTPKNSHAGSVHELQQLMDSSARFASGDSSIDPQMQKLFLHGSSVGGARPKVLVTDGEHHWIAKFGNQGRDNGVDVVGLEYVCMTLAKSAGLNVPETRLENMPTGKALLVERFDLSPSGGRFHLISLRTLCRESPSLYILTYREVAEKIRQHSGSPDDVTLFFRQMCFNAVIGNVDDHLKNFAMLHDGKSYRLTPAFDLVPDVTGRIQHTLAFEYHYTTNGRELVDIGKAWDVYNPKNIVTEVCTAAAQIAAIASAAGVLDVGIIRAIKMRAAEFLLEIQ